MTKNFARGAYKALFHLAQQNLGIKEHIAVAMTQIQTYFSKLGPDLAINLALQRNITSAELTIDALAELFKECPESCSRGRPSRSTNNSNDSRLSRRVRPLLSVVRTRAGSIATSALAEQPALLPIFHGWLGLRCPSLATGVALHDLLIIQMIHGSAAGFAHFSRSSGPELEALRLQLSRNHPPCYQPSWLASAFATWSYRPLLCHLVLSTSTFATLVSINLSLVFIRLSHYTILSSFEDSLSSQVFI